MIADAPIDPSLVADVHCALTEAKATALPRLPILVTLPSVDELDVLSARFEVGDEGHPDVTDDQWFVSVQVRIPADYEYQTTANPAG